MIICNIYFVAFLKHLWPLNCLDMLLFGFNYRLWCSMLYIIWMYLISKLVHLLASSFTFKNSDYIFIIVLWLIDFHFLVCVKIFDIWVICFADEFLPMFIIHICDMSWISACFIPRFVKIMVYIFIISITLLVLHGHISKGGIGCYKLRSVITDVVVFFKNGCRYCKLDLTLIRAIFSALTLDD